MVDTTANVVATLRLSWHERQGSGHYEYWIGLDCMDSRGDIEAYNALCQQLGAGEHNLYLAPPEARQVASFQSRVAKWMQVCFGPAISADMAERCHRFFEEAAEKVQAHGMTRSEAHQLVDYVFNRPVGEPAQETGGVMVTLAALDSAAGIDTDEAAETELDRINTPETIEKIRAKQAAKPKHSPLPQQVNSLDERWKVTLPAIKAVPEWTGEDLGDHAYREGYANGYNDCIGDMAAMCAKEKL